MDGHLRWLLIRRTVWKLPLLVLFMLSSSFVPFSSRLLHASFSFPQWLPPLPGSFHFGKPTWLTPLLAKVESSARGHLHWWGQIQLLIFSKHYDGMLLQWDA